MCAAKQADMSSKPLTKRLATPVLDLSRLGEHQWAMSRSFYSSMTKTVSE
jgi:hypothetical protein